MNLNPSDYRNVAMAIALGGDHEGGVDTAVGMLRDAAPEEVPDMPQSRKALDAWGIPHTKGKGITLMFSVSPTLAAKLPTGWRVNQRGGGHVELLDATGAIRMRWHIHGWDPVSLTVMERYYTKIVDLSPTESVLQVYDGTVVVHTIRGTYPHPRIVERHESGAPWYRNGHGHDAGWTDAMGLANYQARETLRLDGNEWLAGYRPNYRDSIQSWL